MFPLHHFRPLNGRKKEAGQAMDFISHIDTLLGEFEKVKIDDSVFFKILFLERLERGQLEQELADFVDFLQEQAKNYIWQHDELDVEVKALSSSSSQERRRGYDDEEDMYIYGSLMVGENVEDGWFLLSLLWLYLDLVKRDKQLHPLVFLADSDGEFLFVETAFHLPDFLSPSNASNRLCFTYSDDGDSVQWLFWWNCVQRK